MNKKLFDKIIGSDFTITNFKVSSRKDLYEVLNQQYSDLNHRLFDQNTLQYEFAPEEMTPDNVGLHSLMTDYNLNSYFTYSNETKEYADLIIKRLSFTFSSNSKVELLENELKVLGQQFSENPYNELLTPDNYYNEIRTYEFFYGLWILHKSENLDIYLSFKKKYLEIGFDSDELMEDNVEEKSFRYFFRILQRYTILKIMLLQIAEDNTILEEKEIPISEKIKYNRYPKVFKNGYATELFNYLITVEKKPIGPSWVYKYFLLFKDEKLIKSKSKPSDFLIYLQKEHGKRIEINKWDNRTGYNKDNESYLSDIKKDFNSLHDVKHS